MNVKMEKRRVLKVEFLGMDARKEIRHHHIRHLYDLQK